MYRSTKRSRTMVRRWGMSLSYERVDSPMAIPQPPAQQRVQEFIRKHFVRFVCKLYIRTADILDACRRLRCCNFGGEKSIYAATMIFEIAYIPHPICFLVGHRNKKVKLV